jgi:two-component system, NarL family, sensor kinase
MKSPLVVTPDSAQDLERVLEMLSNAIHEMRRVAHNIIPESLANAGLDVALKEFCQAIAQSSGLRISYQSVGLEDATLEQTPALIIYRIVQELIHNTIRHAAANYAIVQLTMTNRLLVIAVEDDGKGFDTAVLQKSKGNGWRQIQHNIGTLKGKQYVSSEPGKGTSILIEINFWKEGNIDANF